MRSMNGSVSRSSRASWRVVCGLVIGASPIVPLAHAQNESSLVPEKKDEKAAAPAAPAPEHAPAEAPAAASGGDEISLAAFSEPVQLTTLVELLATTLRINVQVKGDIPGTVVFNAPVAVRKENLMGLVDALLEQQGYTITLNSAGFYAVVPLTEVPVNVGTERPNTRVIATPNIRPSSLQQVLQAQLGAAGGQGTAGGGAAFLDDLGVIVVTGPVRRLDAMESLVKKVVEEYARSEFIRVELKHVAAPVARDRALQLVGQASASSPGDPVAAAQAAAQAAAAGGRAARLDNLGDRLTVDPQSNALIFRGVPAEIDQVRRVLEVIDRPSQLEPRRYAVGPEATRVADIAKTRGLGEVTTISTDRNTPGGGVEVARAAAVNAQAFGAAQRQASVGGSTMVVDEQRGTILYYATAEQHDQLSKLITELDPQSEVIVIKEYKLAHSKAADVADLVNALIRNEAPVASNALLPDGGRRSQRGGSGSRTGRSGSSSSSLTRDQPDRTTRDTSASRSSTPRTPSTPSGELALGEIDAFVVADEKNNQIIVKSAQKYQEDFKKLIDKLDKRRPQVYIEAKIVSVTWDDAMRLRFENQLVNASGAGGVFQTNFGLSTTGTSTTITTPKVPNPGLGGFTAALIQSKYTPIIINALQTEADAKIVASPQLLVDDNEEATIVSLDQQPTTTTTIGTGGQANTTTFNDFVDAGTTLYVSPQISGGAELVLEYEVQQSSFTGQGSNGVPPPRQENTVSSRVTLPSDSTVVVGGLTVDSRRKTIVKVPLLGDIPLVGLLFQDRDTGDRKTTLYVFLTPRIVRDPNFADLRLLTMGPMATAGLKDDFPPLHPSAMEMGDLPPGAKIESPIEEVPPVIMEGE